MSTMSCYNLTDRFSCLELRVEKSYVQLLFSKVLFLVSTPYRVALLLLQNGFSLAWSIANLLLHTGPCHVHSLFSLGMCACGTYFWPSFYTACMHYPTLRQKPVMRNPGITDCYPYTVLLQQMYLSWSAPGHWVNINPITVQGTVYGDAITDTEPSLCSASALEPSGLSFHRPAIPCNLCCNISNSLSLEHLT